MSARPPFTRHRGVAAPLLMDNIDTDQIIPSREMKAVSRLGLDEGLFAGQRYRDAAARDPDPDFVLNRPAYAGATIFLAGANFGCGSSREHAVWALSAFGVRAVIAPSFGEIFFNNCARNGVLAIVLDAADIGALADYSRVDPQTRLIDIDLPGQVVQCGEAVRRPFDIDPYQKQLLISGADPIGLTLKRTDEIAAFLKADGARRPWIYR